MEIPPDCYNSPDFKRRFLSTIRLQLKARGFDVESYSDEILEVTKEVFQESYTRIKRRTAQPGDPALDDPIEPHWRRFFNGFSRNIAWEQQRKRIQKVQREASVDSPEEVALSMRLADPTPPIDQVLADRSVVKILDEERAQIDNSPEFHEFVTLTLFENRSIRDALCEMGDPAGHLRSRFGKQLKELRLAVIKRLSS
jgi:hypothetical protein